MKADFQLTSRTSGVDIDDLAGLRLFANANLDVVTDLLRDCPVHVLRKDEVLLVPGIRNHHLYLLLRGRLRVHLDSLDSEPVRQFEAGEAVGEISVVDEKPTSAYVVADSASTVVAIDQATFWSLVNVSHAVARNMLLMLVERMRANNVLVADGMRLREEYRRQNNVDELTGLRNARTLIGLLRRQMLRSSMGHKPLALLLIDIDNFKRFSHDFGFAAGDHAVCAVAQTLQDQLRPTDIVARVSGEKFAVVLPECDASGAHVVAARLREAAAEAVIVMSDESILPSVTISIGIAEMRDLETAEEVMAAAEQALTRAQDSGSNTCSN